MTEDQAEALMDARAAPATDRRQEKTFKAERPAKDLPCIVPGCQKLFRPSTMFKDYEAHMRSKHPTIRIVES